MYHALSSLIAVSEIFFFNICQLTFSNKDYLTSGFGFKVFLSVPKGRKHKYRGYIVLI